MLRFGLPTGFNWFFEFSAFVFFVNVVVAGLGTDALAAMNSVLPLNSRGLHAGLRARQRGRHPRGPGHRRRREGRGAAARCS